jgi:hypothetical protein
MIFSVGLLTYPHFVWKIINHKRIEKYTNLCCRNRKTSKTGSISTQERFRTQNISKNSAVLNTNGVNVGETVQ